MINPEDRNENSLFVQCYAHPTLELVGIRCDGLKVFFEYVRRIGVNQIYAILNRRAGFREITAGEPMDSGAAAKRR